MATPKWFDANAYMQNKLAQLKAQEPDAGWTLDRLYDAFREGGFVGAEGQYEHFVKFGAAEEVAPNAYFNADEYYAAKAKQYYEEELKQEFTGSEEQIAYVKAKIKDAGMNAWTHYQQFGSAEGVNPSNAFDASDYCAAKAAAMIKAGQKAPDGTEWTAEKIAEAIEQAGMSVLEHYMTYAGTGEGEVAAGSTYPVSEDEQVVLPNPGETFYLTKEIDNLTGTAGDDVFRVVEAEQMTQFDTVDGGAGNDTLEVYGNAELKGTFTNIENLVIVDATQANKDEDIDLSTFSGSFTLRGDKDTAVTVTNVAGQKLVLDGASGTTLTAKMDGTQTSVKLVNEGSTGASFQAEGDKLASMDLTTNANTTFADGSGNTVKNVAITALADATITLTDLTKLENVTVAGAGSVNLIGATKADINATGSTGGVTVNGKLVSAAAFTGGAGNDTITLGASTKAHDMGAGDDTVKITEALGKGVSINGGDGIDTLEMTTDIAKNFRVGDAITGFEILKLTTGTGTVDMDNFGDINHVIAGTEAVTVKNIDSNGTIEFNETANVDMIVTVKDAEKADNASDVLNVTIADDGNVTVQKLTVNDVENINITADDTDFVAGGAATHVLTLAADKATNVTVSGDAKLTLTLDATSAAIKDINASENTGGLTVDLGSTLKGVTVTGSSAADTITMGIGNTVTGGEGKDTFIATAATDATVSFSTIMNFEAGDKLQIAGMASLEKVDIESGTTNFDAVVTKALESATSTNAAWFVYDNNTYVVLDGGSNDDIFDSGDYLVQLNGVVDLSKADASSLASGFLTLPEGA